MRARIHVLLFYLFALLLPLYWLPLFNVQNALAVFAIQYDHLVMMGFIVMFVAYAALGRIQPEIRVDSVLLSLLVFNGIVALLSIALFLQDRPPSIVDHMTTWIQLVFNSVFFIAVYHLPFRDRDIHRVLRFHVLVAFIVAVFGVGQFFFINVFDLTGLYVTSPSIEYATGRSGRTGVLGIYRATSILIEPRHYGNYLITPLFLTAASFFLDDFDLFRRDVTVAIALVIAVGLLTSFSRSAYALTALSVAVVPLLLFNDKRDILSLYGTTVAAVGVFVGVLAVTGHQTSIENTIQQFMLSKYAINNLFNFDVEFYGVVRYIRGTYLAILYTIQNPLLGVGLNQAYLFIDFRLALVTPPFLLLMSVGVPGALSFLLFIMMLVTRLVKSQRFVDTDDGFHRSLLVVGVLFVLLAVIKSLVGSRYNYPGTWFWFDISVGALIYTTIRRNSVETDD